MNLMLNMKDIYKILATTHFKCKKSKKKNTFLQKHVSLSCLHFSLMFSEGEVKSPYFLQVWWALGSLYFYILLLLMPVSGSVLLLYAGAHNIIELSLSRKKCSSKYVVKNARNVTQFVWQPFSIEFQGFVKKRIKYIHQNLRYYETIEQIPLMVVKIESYAWETNYNIWSSLISSPPSSKTTKE